MEKDIRNQSNWGQQKRSYENSPWINVHDWQVTKHTNSKTNEDFWDIKLAKGTFIEVEGERVDVSGYHFHTNYEPSVSFGDPGTPRCKRGIHFPRDGTSRCSASRTPRQQVSHPCSWRSTESRTRRRSKSPTG